MRVSIKRTGGFAGLIDDLGSAEAPPSSALVSAVERLRSAGVGEHIGADLFRYEVTVEEGGRSETRTFQDGDPPESPVLRELIGLVQV